MAKWSDVLQAAPEPAQLAQARVEATGLALLATLRRDGSPRISGIEPLFAGGELWLGMMPGSTKALDLLRDPRFALHNATIDKQVAEGDAKLAGVAVDASGDADVERFRAAFREHSGHDIPPGPIQLFRADVRELSTLQPAGDHLRILIWREGGEVREVERY